MEGLVTQTPALQRGKGREVEGVGEGEGGVRETRGERTRDSISEVP